MFVVPFAWDKNTFLLKADGVVIAAGFKQVLAGVTEVTKQVTQTAKHPQTGKTVSQTVTVSVPVEFSGTRSKSVTSRVQDELRAEQARADLDAQLKAERKAASPKEKKVKPTKPKGPVKYLAFLYNAAQFQCRGLIFDKRPARRTALAEDIVAKAKTFSKGKDVVIIMPKNLSADAAAELIKAGARPADVGGTVTFTTHDNWEARDPFEGKSGQSPKVAGKGKCTPTPRGNNVTDAQRARQLAALKAAKVAGVI